MKKVISIIIVLSVILSTFPIFNATVFAASVTYYETSEDSVPLRYGIGEEKETVSRIPQKGTVFKVIESKKNKTSWVTWTNWHKIIISPEYTNNGVNSEFWLWNGNVTKHKHNMKDSVCQSNGCDYHEPISDEDFIKRELRVKTSTSAIRQYPYLGGKEIDRLSKGAPVTTIGAVKNSKNHIWYVLDEYKGYIYSENVEVLSNAKSEAISNSIKNGGGNTGNNGSSSGGSSTGKLGNTNYFTPPSTTVLCSHINWSVGKCVNCGEEWVLKEVPINDTFIVDTDSANALDIPYKQGKVKKTYSKGAIIPVVAKAENSARHTWYKTSDGYWIYNIKNVNLKRAVLNISGYTFYSANETYTPKVICEPSNAVVSKTWRIADNATKIATVDASTGKITPKGSGKAKVFCEVRSKEGTIVNLEFQVTVNESAFLEPWNYDNQSYDKNLALECAEYSALAYQGNGYKLDTNKNAIITSHGSVTSTSGMTLALGDLLKKRNFNYKISNNYYSPSKTTAPLVIASKKVKYNNSTQPKDLVFVIIQGSNTKEAWQGNMMMSGTTYAELNYHYTFSEAAVDAEKQLEIYLNENKIKNPLVVITGHSRGAAAGNLLAKNLTGKSKYEKIYAYLFATPNTTKSPDNSLKNIINICNELDFVTYMPFSTKWGFEKHGKIYSFNSAEWLRTNGEFADMMMIEYGNPDYNWQAMTPSKARDYVVGKWPTVEKYYNSEVTTLIYTSPPSYVKESSPYNYFLNGLALAACGSGGLGELLKHLSHSCDLGVLTNFFAQNGLGGRLSAFGDCHSMITYHAAMSTKRSLSTSKANLFSEYLYGNGTVALNQEESDALYSFFSQSENELMLEVAGWNIEDSSTWQGIKWDINGNIVSIDLSYLNLSGWLNANSFPKLQNLNIDGNSISMLAVTECEELVNLSCMSNNISYISVSNCNNLQNLDCSFNQIGELDVSNMPQLSELNCYGNQINDLNLSGATALQTVRCGNNELGTIDISTNTSLSTFYCDNNNIIESQNESLLNSINEINLNGGTAVIGVQKYNENYDFNASELSSLTEFANMSLNLEKLGWDLEAPYTWQGVEWKIVGDEYCITAINFDGLDLEGDLNLPEAKHIESVSCADSSLSILNLSGCTNLGSVNCYNSGISTLEIEDCSLLNYLNCDENYLAVETVESSLNQIGLSTGIASYETQNIAADEENFNQSERETLIALLSTGANAEILGWDWNWPGTWSGIVWTNIDGEYRVNKINFSDMDICGELDLTSFEYLEDFNFSGTQIESVILPSSITKIPEYAFYNSGIKYIHISEGVTSIEKSAFSYCDNLNTVVLPTSVTKILDNAFYESENLKSLIFIGNPPIEIGNEIAYGASTEFKIIFFEDTMWDASTELLTTYSYKKITNDYVILLDDDFELKEDSYYGETNNYSGDDINVTIVAKTPGTSATCLLSVYDERGGFNNLASLPMETNRYMNTITFEDVDVQYVGEEYCTLKVFLWNNLNSLSPLSYATEKILTKPVSE